MSDESLSQGSGGPFQRAYNAALRLLSYRPRSETEVRSRLLRKFPPEVTDRVALSLAEHGLLDDQAFAQFWRNSRQSLNPRSASLIRRELISLGVKRDTAQEAVLDMDDQEAAYSAALKVVRRLAKLDAPTFRRRAWAYLQRRGFSPSVIRLALQRLKEEAELSWASPPTSKAKNNSVN